MKQARLVSPRRSPWFDPTITLLWLSLGLAGVAGLGVGLWLIWAISLGSVGGIPFAALAQAHGQVQLVGFLGLFVVGTAAQLLPGFLAVPLRQRGRLGSGGYILAASLLLRLIAQAADPSLGRDVGLWVAAIGELAALTLILSAFFDLARRTVQPAEPWRRLVVAGLACLAAGALLNLAATATLVGGGEATPEPLDAAIVQLELGGFVVLVVFGVSRKILSRFLLLAPPTPWAVDGGAALYLAGVVVAALGQLAGLWLIGWPSLAIAGLGAYLALIGALGFVCGLKLYQRPARPSTAPHVTEPARLWIRLAFGWLVVGALIGAASATAFFAAGTSPNYFAISAARHAVGEGFAMTLIVGLGSRILPGFAAWAIKRPTLMAWLVAGVSVGALLRVVGELGVAVVGLASEQVAAAGGTISALVFAVFAIILLRSLGRT
jgi:hypothetical protein